MIKLLIVEDDITLRTVYELIATSAGFNVETAENGLEGLSKLKSFEPEVVLLDMLMPIKSGLDLLKEANITKNYPATSVVILSNLSDSAMIDSALKLGAKEHLIKANVLPNQIISTIKKYG